MLPTNTEFRDVKQIITVPSSSGATQIFTVTKKSIWKPQIVAPVGPIQPGVGVSLLKKKPMVRSSKSKMVPNILRTGSKRKSLFVRGHNSHLNTVLGRPMQRSNASRNITATVQYASTSNQPFLSKLNKPNPQFEIISPSAQSQNEEILPLEPEIELRIKEEVIEREENEESQNESLSAEPNLLESSVSFGKSVLNTSFLNDSTAHDSIPNQSPVEESPVSESTSPNTAFVKKSIMNKSLVKEPPSDGYENVDQKLSLQTVDDLLDNIAGNVCHESESFYMVSHESLMEALSTCRICAAASEVTLTRRGTTCQAHIQCRRSLSHSFNWTGEKCRSLGRYQHHTDSKNSPNTDSLLPRYDIPWSLILVSLVAKIVGIPLRKIELLLQSIFTRTCLEKTLDMASSFVTSFAMLHGLTKPQLAQRVDHVKVFVVCRKLLVFLDPSTFYPLSCFEAPGSLLWTMSDLSTALNIGLQRLQLLSSTKFSSVRVLQSNHASGDLSEWKPVLVPDMELLLQEALGELNSVLWQNDLQVDSMIVGEILAEVTRALCFFVPNVARMSKEEGRDHLSLLLADLVEIHKRQYVPKISELALLRNDLKGLSRRKSDKLIALVVNAFSRIDIHSILCSLYEKIISTADASYVVSICNEKPSKETHKVMTMVDLCQEEEATLENALRVLLLLPLPKAPVSLIEEMYASYESGL